MNYLQPLPPPRYPVPKNHQGDEDDIDVDGGYSGVPAGSAEQQPSGEALLLERLGESVWAEEKAKALDLELATHVDFDSREKKAAAIAAAAAAATAAAAVAAGLAASNSTQEGDADGNPWPPLGGEATDIGARTATERALTREARDMGTAVRSWEADNGWGGMDIGYRDREEWENEKLSEEAAAAALAAWGIAGAGSEVGVEKERWGEGEVGEMAVANEAMEMSALAVTLRQYPE